MFRLYYARRKSVNSWSYFAIRKLHKMYWLTDKKNAVCFIGPQNWSCLLLISINDKKGLNINSYIKCISKSLRVVFLFQSLTVAFSSQSLGVVFPSQSLGVVFLSQSLGVVFLSQSLGVVFLSQSLGVVFLSQSLGVVFLIHLIQYLCYKNAICNKVLALVSRLLVKNVESV